MANHFLCIDAGNSAIKWSLSSGNDLSEMMTLPYPENISSDNLVMAWKQLEQPSHVIASCVASDTIWQAITAACNELWNIDVQRVLSLKQGHGLINAYDVPSELGSDRWCAMIGAFHAVDNAFIIIDAGSAITIDLVSHDGQHMGGYITPGLNMMKQSLGLNAAQINITLDKSTMPSLLPANSTNECITAGVYLSVVKLIESVFERESRKAKSLKCILTGGDANLIADLLSCKCVIMPDVVLCGLMEIGKENRE